MPPRVHVLDVPGALQPESQPFPYPPHNDDWGIEQDFLAYLGRHPELAVGPEEADWHYLPVFWTRWNLNHDYGRAGRDELQSLVGEALLDPARTFTVCQYADGPLIELGDTTLLLASRSDGRGIDVPLLCAAHPRPRLRFGRRRLASFAGRLDTHPIREELATAVATRKDVRIVGKDIGTRRFVRSIAGARIALSPRGHGGTSFRFFEAMQLGVTPMLIGDIDTRPFKNSIDWEACSYYAADVGEAIGLLDRATPDVLDEMGRRAEATWRESLAWGKWCRLALEQL